MKFLKEIRPTKSDHHVNITCDGCQKKEFNGPRFKCFKCSDYDLCLKCFKTQVKSYEK